MRFARIPVSNRFGGYNFEAPSPRGASSRWMSAGPGGDDIGPNAPDPGVIAEDAAEVMSKVPEMNQEMGRQQAGFAVGAKADATAEEIYRKAERDAQRKLERANRKAGLFGRIAKITELAANFIPFCDMRVKHDIAPLLHSDVNDELSSLAFAVKSLRDNP